MAADASSDAGLSGDTKASEIIAQPLSQALNVFAKDTGLQLIYLSQLAVNRRSQPVPAGLFPALALTRLLEGTGLDFSFLNERTVEIFAHSRGNGPTVKSTPPPERFTSNALAEIVVTATKREEPLSLVPMSISVLSADQMQLQDVRTIGDIAERTPGLMFDFDSTFGAAVLTNFAIRGIGTSSGAPMTGIYIGDVPIQIGHVPIEASLNVFRNAYPVTFDLDRVEVLRGPQNTLFGSNAPAGAVRFIPNEANATQFSQSYHFEVQTSQNAGMSSELGAAVGGPIVEDRFGARVSAWYRADGGYIDHVDPFNGSNIDSDSNRSLSKAARLGFVVQPTDSLRILPSVAYQSVYRHDTPAFYTYLSDPGDAVLLNGRLLRQPAKDTFTLTSLKFDESLGDVDLTGITGYFERTSDATVDQTNQACILYFGTCDNPLGPAYPSSYSQAVATVITQHQAFFTQELRLAYSDPTARVTWLAGAFYSNRHEHGLRDTYAITQPSDPGIYSDIAFSGKEISAFGQLRLALFSRWHLDLGARGGWSRSDSSSFQGGFSNYPLGFARTVSKLAPLPSEPRFDLAFQPDADDFFYAEVAKGARGGGSNTPALCNGIAVPTTYASDAIWNYEVGAKNLLLDHRLQLAASLFFIRWDDIQESIADACGNSYTAAIGGGSSKGFDLTAQALLSKSLRLSLALGLTDARYDRTVLTAGGQIVDDRGTAIGSGASVASPWSGTLALDYRRPLTPNLTAYLAADDSFTTRNPGPFTANDPNALGYSPWIHKADPSTNRLNLRIGVIRSSVNVKISMENVLNSLPTLRINSDATASQLFYAYTFRPRTVGLTIDWQP